MCITSETCRADSVIKTAQNNLHQAGPNKTHICENDIFSGDLLRHYHHLCTSAYDPAKRPLHFGTSRDGCLHFTADFTI